LLEYLPELDYSKGDDLGDDLDNYYNTVAYQKDQQDRRVENLYDGYASDLDFD
jgi:hypothetical protein